MNDILAKISEVFPRILGYDRYITYFLLLPMEKCCEYFYKPLANFYLAL
jgi:hypothetical protein